MLAFTETACRFSVDGVIDRLDCRIGWDRLAPAPASVMTVYYRLKWLAGWLVRLTTPHDTLVSTNDTSRHTSDY